MASSTKTSISALPLPPPSHTLTKNLTPDPVTPSPKDFRQIQNERPSVQRRARMLAAEAHFSYVAPCPLPFPFRITPEEGEEVTDQAAFIEKWLAAREALREEGEARPNGLHLYYPDDKREGPRVLIGLSQTGWRDCVPHLDVGDALEILGTPRLTKFDEKETIPTHNNARQELIDVLSGHAVLMNPSEGLEQAWAPWSLRYSGHQFGVWAGQLGDGRAVSLLATPHPSDPDTTYELQLKGGGRTPFARSADGLAAVRSSIREFLCAEAMHALGIPSTRSLALVSLPELPVLRERLENACVLTRMAPSFIRVGSFEALNPPESMFFLGMGGGGQQDSSWEGLRKLGEWVGRRVLKLEDVSWREEGKEGDAWGRKLVLESTRRNAKMVAGWQAYGFMHGVINTDNVSIMGLTIDYGPYAFMDVFDPFHICNHSDSEGRYSYQAQPSVVMFAMRALLNSLAPLIGAEASLGHAVGPGWAENATPEQISEWRKKGKESTLKDLEDLFQSTCAEEYRILIHKRLGLRRVDSDDESKLSRPLLNMLSDHKLDFHSTFRRLAYFRPSTIRTAGDDGKNPDLDKYIASLLNLTPEPDSQSVFVDEFKAKSEWKSWLEKYAARIEAEKTEWGTDGETDEKYDQARQTVMRAANPRFLLRQWVLEEVIKKVEEDSETGKKVLAKVLQMACTPFDPWGAEDDPTPEDSLDEEVREERRFCGIGARQMLGFQCSCSS